MGRKIDDIAEVAVAVVCSSSSGALVGTAVSLVGYGRARFVFTFGMLVAPGSLASAGIWECATSNGTFTSKPLAQLTAASSGLISDAVAVIDVGVNPDKPWLKVSGALSGSMVNHSVTVTKYNGTRLVKASTALAEETVSVY